MPDFALLWIGLLMSMTDALPRSTLPFVVVACKSDGSLPVYQRDPTNFEQARRILGEIEAHQTSLDDPESHKACISILLRAIIANTPGKATPIIL